MFKYNILSDLKDGTLTTPLRKEGNFIVCKDENGIETKRTISDFDFAKTVEERDFVLSDDLTSSMESDLKEEITNSFTASGILFSIILSKPMLVRKTENLVHSYSKNIKVSSETQRIK